MQHLIYSSLQPWEQGTGVSPILQVEKLRPRDQAFAQGKEDNNQKRMRILTQIFVIPKQRWYTISISSGCSSESLYTLTTMMTVTTKS